ncbi:major facilitator superfamily MFS_1 [Kribbella flavida DSM 17836]|uniref:Major facilitator superfamily MFS_1 n=1 Tax=Kribbella flavida (strain DSM 17836 / JCM 10339 / NBRC 14399) TaxID=479435 RepID=D2PUT9_KRIFD|nr:MFS transporter [Kribbella flavida]ADB31405.1 major facilitator superfamily MFS_1 [Kribbella flavida DSM 17836]
MTAYWRRVAELPGWLKAVMLGQLVSSAGALAWLYLTLYLVEDRGMSPQQAGFAAAAYGVGLLGGNLGGGWIGDRFGLRAAAVGSQVSWAVACLAMPIVPTTGLAVLAAVAGLCGGASRPNLSALVATAMPAHRRREGIALSRSASNAGFTIGPPLGGLLAAYDFSLVFVIDAATSLVLAVVVWRWVPRASRVVVRQASGLWSALRQDRSILVLLAAIVVVDTVYRQLFATMPLLLRDAGSPAVAYGVLIGLSSVVIVLLEAPLAVRLGGHRALRVVAVGFVFVGIGLAALGVWPALGGAALAVAVITCGEMLYKPTATAHVADAAPEGMVGRYSSLYAAASISGMFLAPALGGTAYEHVPDLLYPAAAVLAFAAAAAVLVAGRAAGRTGVSLAVGPEVAAVKDAGAAIGGGEPDGLPSGSTGRPSSGS